ncbi:MAG: PD40 domain-containing protein [Thermoplasmata archaeon]|nr:MAG: PD40 domain-containing protein [Thermoplasmata archaeon]
MSGPFSFSLRLALLALLSVGALCLLASAASALPGDLSVELELEEQNVEARPEEGPDTVTLHGNLTFDQPIWQYASATIILEIDTNWSASASPSTVTNRGVGTQSFTVNVEVPTSTRGGQMARIEVIAEYSTRFGDPSLTSDLATITVRPWVGYRVNVTDAVELVVAQGTSGTLKLPLRNVGNVPDTFASSVPYWYGLRPLGLTVESPVPVRINVKEEMDLEFSVFAATDTIPRLYVFDLLVDAASLPRGGHGATEDPRVVRAKVHVTGLSPPDDPYEAWSAGDPPSPLAGWNSVFGASAPRNNPDVDPSGTYVVYDQFNGNERQIFLGQVSGSGSRPLTHGWLDHHPVISPNGQMVAFAREPDRIIIVNHNGTELMEFGTEFGWVNLTDWSASGDRILFDASGVIYELDLRYNSTRRLAGEPVEQWGAVYSTDGGRIFYLSYEAAGDRPEVWSMTSDGSAHRQLTFNDVEERSVSVSPNGARVAFTLEERNGRGDRVCVMNPDGSQVRFFTDLSRDVFVLRWLPEGDSLMAEVSSHNASTHDIERVEYPWKDAGAPGGGDGDGGDNGGGPGAGWWDDLTMGYGNYVLIVIGVVVAASVAGVFIRRRRRRGMEASADELKHQMESEERARWEQARQGIEVPNEQTYGEGTSHYQRYRGY